MKILFLSLLFLFPRIAVSQQTSPFAKASVAPDPEAITPYGSDMQKLMLQRLQSRPDAEKKKNDEENRRLQELLHGGNKKEKGISYDSFLRDLLNGDRDKIDRLGMVARLNVEISGLTGARYVENLKSGIKRNHVPSIVRYALMSQEGIFVPKNFALAASLFKKAADLGDGTAMNSLGLYTRFGIGVPKNETAAEDLFKKAVLKNTPYAFYNLARLYADQKKFLESHLLADLAEKRIDREKEKKKFTLVSGLKKKSRERMNPFQTAYDEKYIPYWLSPVLSKQDKGNKTVWDKMPSPPSDMIYETPFMKYISKDDFDNKYKKFQPFMPSAVLFKNDSPADPFLKNKTPIAPTPRDADVIAALYYRPADARYFQLMLETREDAAPFMVGDIFSLYVPTPLYEDAATKKGGHMYMKNTAYKIVLRSPDGTVTTDYAVTLIPVNQETAGKQAWIKQSFAVQKEGVALIDFVPQDTPDGFKAFPHTFKIVATAGKPPK